MAGTNEWEDRPSIMISEFLVSRDKIIGALSSLAIVYAHGVSYPKSCTSLQIC